MLLKLVADRGTRGVVVVILRAHAQGTRLLNDVRDATVRVYPGLA